MSDYKEIGNENIYQQEELQSYRRIQQAAKQTMVYIKNIIRSGMNLLEIRRLCV